VPVRVNGPTRSSRLFRNNLGYVWQAVLSMVRAYAIYRPGWIFGVMAFLFLIAAVLLGGRYLMLMMEGEGQRHVQSVIACATLTLCGVFMGALGIVAHLLCINRRLLEEIRYVLRAEKGRHPVSGLQPNRANCGNFSMITGNHREKPTDFADNTDGLDELAIDVLPNSSHP
jgi:hypothetical protein